MTITGVETNSAVSALNLQCTPKTDNVQNAGAAEITDKFSESGEVQKFREIAGKYDITSMSRNEMNSMCKELYDNGLISFKEMAFATFDPTHIPGWQDGVSSVNGWKMSSNPDAKMNFLEGFRTKADWNEKYGDSKFQQNFDMMVDLAEKIHYFQT